MWLMIAFPVALVLGMTPYWVGIWPPLKTRCLLRISGNVCRAHGESISPQVLNTVAELLRQADVKKGFIAITAERRVKFSYQIPKALHQRLRNVLFNP